MTTLTEKTNIDDLIHNLSYDEVWAMGRGAEPIQMNWLAGKFDEEEAYFTTENGTILSAELLDQIQYNPLSLRLSDILAYCKAIDAEPILLINDILKEKY